MSPLYKILLVAAHAVNVALIAFPQVSPSFALAKPIGRPLSPRTMAVHHVKERSVRAPLRSKNSKAKAAVPHNSHPSPANVSYHPQAYSYPGSHLPAGAHARSGDINVDTTLHDINILNTYYTGAYKNAQTLKAYSSRASASKQKGAHKFQQKCASTLTDFHTNSRGFTKTFSQMGAHEGHAHHDDYEPRKELLKKFIDALKEVLGDIYELFRCQPELRPILGPIIYDIKCIIDELLNDTENLAVIIADLKPLLESVDDEYGQAACKSGIDLIGLCI